MAEFKLDRIRFRWKADWAPTTVYAKDDMVYYEGKTYACVAGHTSTTDFYAEYGITPKHLKVKVEDNKFYINSLESPALDLRKGDIYIFDLSDSSLTGNIFRFSNEIDGSENGGILFQDGVTVSGTPGTANASITIQVNSNTPNLHYYNQTATGYGNTANVSDAKWRLVHDGSSWKSDWQASTSYSVGDIVKFGGNLYQCMQQHTSVIVTNLGLAHDIDKWKIIAETYDWNSVWASTTVYKINDVVRYSGTLYICNTYHTSASTLEADQSKWNTILTADEWKTDWEADTKYSLGDLVKYGGIVYRCITGHFSAATVALGLENDLTSWEVVNSGIEFKFDWEATTRYKKNDIVKYGQSLYICVLGHDSNTLFRDDETDKWQLWLPGLGYEAPWDNSTEYSKGDIVLYGGYTYVALQNNTSSIPADDGMVRNTGNWDLLDQGMLHKGEWNNTTEYKTGDIVRNGGGLYVAVQDNFDTYPDIEANWDVVVPGQNYKGSWQDDNEYYIGDIVFYRGITYSCIQRHQSTASDSRPDLDQEFDQEDYWEVLIQGTETNKLSTQGDMLTYDDTSKSALSLGEPGESLKSTGASIEWSSFGETEKVYYVSIEGVDSPTVGTTINAPFRTVKFACDYILENQEDRAPATIYIKTGIYEEILPISVPADVALVGDELRSTVIQPAAGYEQSDMFFVRNGTGIRNMTLQGLFGTLGDENLYRTRRPTAGAYVSLDPGNGAADSSVWITNKSCYVQNVTTFGTGCIGMKVDGSLHNGGNRSIVANDFTQVLDDGIGVWVNEEGLSELVSVFTYFCHIGYLATVGGKIRATNGNNSYGTYGSVAEEVNQDEEFITANIDNRTSGADISIVHNNGNQIMAIAYEHAGQNYSSSTISFTGSGANAAATMTDFRNGAVSNVRIRPRSDSSIAGGLNYTLIQGDAQEGDATTITLAAGDIQEDATKYIGQRIFIISGVGAGQYGYIQNYDTDTKVATIYKESDDTAGWDIIDSNFPIETLLNITTRYQIEPRVTFDSPSSGVTAWGRAVIKSSRFVGINIYDPGSGYSSPPNITVVDNESTLDAEFDVYINDGVLGKPTFTNRGTGWVRSSAEVTGNGFAEKYQTGSLIKVSNLTREPGPGDNVTINGIDDVVYRLVRVDNLSGSEPNLTADIFVYPTIGDEESPEHITSITLRQFYSQVRLTGHDFLDIGTGNVNSTRYPNLYVEGITSLNAPQQQNEAVESAGGRVFYTSTDQDGNFRVGELFRVEQSSGIVTVNASQFNLTGLTELSLGGIQVGGSAVVIQEFSKDGTFVANSNNLVPTEAAIIKFVNSRISGGTSDATTNKLTAGQVVLSNNTIDSTVGILQLPNKVNFTAGVDGDMLAMQYFRHRSQRNTY